MQGKRASTRPAPTIKVSLLEEKQAYKALLQECLATTEWFSATDQPPCRVQSAHC